MNNEQLKELYDKMHSKGSTSWFSDGREERETILKMGEPWKGLGVLEIGCGEGELTHSMAQKAATVIGIDYSEEAIRKGKHKYHDNNFYLGNYKTKFNKIQFGRIVMQGVLEHLDDPFTELKWMMDNLLGEHGDIITSSPCFLNPRGIVWMTLDMLGAVMSKTDLHFLHPWQFDEFCQKNGYTLKRRSCDWSWGWGKSCCDDLEKRIPLALKDAGISYESKKFKNFMAWFRFVLSNFFPDTFEDLDEQMGANMIYRITK